jgi:hypothetical protein
MRSAWSPTRSMSFETLFVVLPKRLLASPTVLTTDFMSMSDTVLPMRGTGTPSTFLRLRRLFTTSPPASAAAAAPAATAGPLALPAPFFSVARTPVPL